MADHPLKTDVDLAQAMARYIAGASILELQLSGVFTALVGDWSLTETLLHRERSISRRVDLVLDLAGLLSDQDERKAAIAALGPSIRDCIAYRNKLAHGLFTDPDEGKPVELMTWVVERGRKVGCEPVSAEIINEQLAKLSETRAALQRLGFEALPPDSLWTRRQV